MYCKIDRCIVEEDDYVGFKWILKIKKYKIMTVKFIITQAVSIDYENVKNAYKGFYVLYLHTNW
jgi:hypothetical protein